MSEEPELNSIVYQYVKNACDEFGLIKEGDRILVGLSGGKDSLLLTHVLGKLMKDMNYSVEEISELKLSIVKQVFLDIIKILFSKNKWKIVNNS